MVIIFDNDTEIIYGAGATLQEAVAMAEEFSDDAAIRPVHGLAISNAPWRWLEAAPALVERVLLFECDVVWYRDSTGVAQLS